MDRAKVIKAVEEAFDLVHSDFIGTDDFNETEWEQNKADAFALLKEREAEDGEWITIWREDDPYTSTCARCSICNRISERPLGGYCKWCGAKMSQEWGVDG